MQSVTTVNGRMTGRLLEGRTVMISGAGRPTGMGLAATRLFLEHGARVAMLDVDEREIADAARNLERGDFTLAIRCDVTKMQDCVEAVERVLRWKSASGRIDVLVNFSGITQKRTITEISQDDFDNVIGVNLKGMVQLAQAVIPTMRSQRSGSIVAVSSMSAQQGGGVYGGGHYCASKAGVLGFTRALARELGPDGIRANAITPGLTTTDFSRSGSTDEMKHATAKVWPLGRASSPMETAGVALFLASDLSSYITGATIDVNGGAYMR
jgi:NAD(P)-dependent dehydrogenase (short-subunit alcohol dehydrogenase family)